MVCINFLPLLLDLTTLLRVPDFDRDELFRFTIFFCPAPEVFLLTSFVELPEISGDLLLGVGSRRALRPTLDLFFKIMFVIGPSLVIFLDE